MVPGNPAEAAKLPSLFRVECNFFRCSGYCNVGLWRLKKGRGGWEERWRGGEEKEEKEEGEEEKEEEKEREEEKGGREQGEREGEGEEKLFCRSFLSPDAFIQLVSKHTGKAEFAALCRKGKAWKQSTGETQSPLCSHPSLTLPFTDTQPKLLWGWGQNDRTEEKANSSSLKKEGVGFSCRALPPKYPGSYLQGEAVYS